MLPTLSRADRLADHARAVIVGEIAAASVAETVIAAHVTAGIVVVTVVASVAETVTVARAVRT